MYNVWKFVLIHFVNSSHVMIQVLFDGTKCYSLSIINEFFVDTAHLVVAAFNDNNCYLLL